MCVYIYNVPNSPKTSSFPHTRTGGGIRKRAGRRRRAEPPRERLIRLPGRGDSKSHGARPVNQNHLDDYIYLPPTGGGIWQRAGRRRRAESARGRESGGPAEHPCRPPPRHPPSVQPAGASPSRQAFIMYVFHAWKCAYIYIYIYIYIYVYIYTHI